MNIVWNLKTQTYSIMFATSKTKTKNHLGSLKGTHKIVGVNEMEILAKLHKHTSIETYSSFKVKALGIRT